MSGMDVELTVLALLALVGFVAGFIDSIAGGGGMLALPSLLLAGLDPLTALATNKLQGTFGTGSAAFAFWKKGHLDPRAHAKTIAVVFVGAALGVLMVAAAPRPVLSIIMPILLMAVAVYFALSPRLTDEASEPVFPMAAFVIGMAPAIGFYDGFFGPGTGSFFMVALVSVFGLGIIEATARTKLFNFTSNIAALAVFLFVAKISWVVGLTMGVAQVAGAQLGARVAIKNGASVIRPLLVLVCIALAIKLLFDPANPLRAYF
jgi:uncharacterized protein